MKINDIAKLCYEANAVYCEILRGTLPLSPFWENAPDEIKASILSGVKYCMKENVSCPEDMHNAWLVYKKNDGWKYGTEKDVDAKTHPNIVPYKQLHPEERMKDKLFLAIVKVCTEAPK